MRSIRRIGVFENSRRIRLLDEYGSQASRYFKTSTPAARLAGERGETPESLEARAEVNRMTGEAEAIVRAAGIPTSISWTPPPMVGGPTHVVDLFHNVFNYTQFEISANTLLDAVQRAAGAYESNHRSSVLRTLNPLHYVGLLLDVLASSPFILAASAGFDRDRMESSAVGRLVKAVIYLAGGAASILTVLHLLGLLDDLRELVGI